MIIKKTGLFLICLIASLSAMAEWTNLGDTDASAIYIDKSTVRKSGNKAKIWLLTDYKSPQVSEENNSYLSVTDKFEFNCKEEIFKITFTTTYLKNMQKGGAVKSFDFSDSSFKPQPVPPNTIASALFKMVCGK